MIKYPLSTKPRSKLLISFMRRRFVMSSISFSSRRMLTSWYHDRSITDICPASGSVSQWRHIVGSRSSSAVGGCVLTTEYQRGSKLWMSFEITRPFPAVPHPSNRMMTGRPTSFIGMSIEAKDSCKGFKAFLYASFDRVFFKSTFSSITWPFLIKSFALLRTLFKIVYTKPEKLQGFCRRNFRRRGIFPARNWKIRC